MREIWFKHDGARLFAVEQGAGAPIVLLHGGGGTHHGCLGLAGALADRYRVITPDLRGSGRSHDGRPLSWGRLADDVAALMDRLAIERAVVGGPSMGAATALRCALRHPGRVSALVMVTPAYGGDDLGLSDFQHRSFQVMDEMANQVLALGVEALRPMLKPGEPGDGGLFRCDRRHPGPRQHRRDRRPDDLRRATVRRGGRTGGHHRADPAGPRR